MVRHALGLDFAGERTWATGSTSRSAGLSPRRRGSATSSSTSTATWAANVCREETERLVRRFSGDEHATLSDPRWLNSARYRHGLAAAYRRGRAFLVGDAARSAPPLYGQGMNHAMQDAGNLAWKLAHVVKGIGPEALLDTFVD